MEDTAGLSGSPAGRGRAGSDGIPGASSPRVSRRLLLLAATGLVLAAAAGPVAAQPAAGSGLVWVRLAVEEESPAGPWTPLVGVEVQALPRGGTLVAELERIRRTARGSGRDYDAAVGRVQAAVAAHRTQVESAGAKGIRRTTDAAGLVVFEGLDPGDWVLVAVRVTAYAASAAPPRRQEARRGEQFLSRAIQPAREAEVWVLPVRVEPGERRGITLTDRARWLVGPVR